MIYYYIILFYLFIVFVLSRLVIPHLGFNEEKISEQIPESMLAKINEIKSRSGDQVQFLNLAYDYLGSKYRSERFNNPT